MQKKKMIYIYIQNGEQGYTIPPSSFFLFCCLVRSRECVCWRVCVSVCKEISRAFPVEEERGEREGQRGGGGICGPTLRNNKRSCGALPNSVPSSVDDLTRRRVAPATRVKGVANTRTHTQTQTHTCSRASHTIVRVPHGATQEGGCGPVDFVKKKKMKLPKKEDESWVICVM